MPRIEPELQRLQEIKTLPSLIKYLKDDLNWPIGSDDVEDVVFVYDPAELGFDSASTAKIEEVCQLRPLTPGQKWGVFWVKFGKKQLPVQMLRRALGNLVVKKRTSTKKADKAAWHMHDLLFISAYGDDSNRHITFAHFSESEDSEKSLPILKVLGWDEDDTLLHLKDTYKTLVTCLNWETTPTDNPDAWRDHWASAFKVGHREVINTTKELVVELAHLATVIKKSVLTSINAETDKGPWKRLMLAFQKTLIKDLNEEQFADVIAQTISYGLLTARLSSDGPINLKNLVDMVPSTNPFLKELLQHFLTSAGMKGLFDVDEAGINDVVELLNRANAQAIRNDFGKKTDGEDPVIHFYEHFLGAYNKKLKVERGVFYTPKPIVSYIVRSVHELLQKEFGLEDGLADTSTWAEVKKKKKDLMIPVGIKPDIEPFVQILDPATGTATFLIEVIDIIHNTMVDKWNNERVPKAEQIKKWNTYVPTHLLPRIYAYELMMAPYAIAHMKVGLKLTETGFTAWEKLGSENRANIFLTNALDPWAKQLDLPGFEALAHEAAAVNEVKSQKRFTVVIGNPPYAGHSANKGIWIEGLVDSYLQVNGTPLKEANSKWLRDDYVKFMRFGQEVLNHSGEGVLGFITNHGYIDNPTFRGLRYSLFNDFRCLWVTDLHGNTKKKERDEHGKSDENVFDIQQGVAVLAAVFGKTSNAQIWHAHVRGNRTAKYARLEKGSSYGLASTPAHPSRPFYLFMPQDASTRREYDSFAGITQDAQELSLGILTKRDSLVVAFSADELMANLRRFADRSRTDNEVSEEFGVPLADKDKWDISTARTYLARIYERNIHPVLYRPFDIRYVYYDDSVVARTNRRVLKNLELVEGNRAFIFGRQGMATGSEDWDVCFACDTLSDQNIYRRGGGTVIPLHLAIDKNGLGLEDSRINLPRIITSHFTEFKAAPEDIFYYVYAVLHSPVYRRRYAEFLGIDFPRLPLTRNLALFRALARHGCELTAMHTLKSPRLSKSITDLVGSRDNEVEKVSWTRGTVWLDKAQTTGFKGVSEIVWKFHIGGYQVCEKWLKDRKGRKLTKDDIAHYQKIVVALSETIGHMAEIDKVIDEHGGWPDAFEP